MLYNLIFITFTFLHHGYCFLCLCPNHFSCSVLIILYHWENLLKNISAKAKQILKEGYWQSICLLCLSVSSLLCVVLRQKAIRGYLCIMFGKCIIITRFVFLLFYLVLQTISDSNNYNSKGELEIWKLKCNAIFTILSFLICLFLDVSPDEPCPPPVYFKCLLCAPDSRYFHFNWHVVQMHAGMSVCRNGKNKVSIKNKSTSHTYVDIKSLSAGMAFMGDGG